MLSNIIVRACQSRLGVYAFSDRRIKLDNDNKISKRWQYLLNKAHEENPMDEIIKYDASKIDYLRGQYDISLDNIGTD